MWAPSQVYLKTWLLKTAWISSGQRCVPWEELVLKITCFLNRAVIAAQPMLILFIYILFLSLGGGFLRAWGEERRNNKKSRCLWIRLWKITMTSLQWIIHLSQQTTVWNHLPLENRDCQIRRISEGFHQHYENKIS